MLLFVRELSTKPIETNTMYFLKGRKTRNDGSELVSFDPGFDINYEVETEGFADECKNFMQEFVNQIFISSNINQEDKGKFGLLIQHQEGREWFAKFVDSQRNNQKEVDEMTFYCLVQYFALCLFECNIGDDFSPATSVMNMCFTYCCTTIDRTGKSSKHFIYQYLKDQPIWKSKRFWSAAFLVAIHVDRTNRSSGVTGWNSLSSEQRKDFEIGEENSTFSHLASFLYMMKSIGVSKTERDEFREKMSTIGNLRNEQIQELEDSVEILQ